MFASTALSRVLSLTPLYPVKAALVFPVLGALVLPVGREHGAPLSSASVITLGRAVLTAMTIAFIGEPRAEDFAWALWFAAGWAFFFDAVDGYVARRTGSTSPFGGHLDMELDGITVFGLCGLLIWLDRTGWWVLTAGLLRYVHIAATMAFDWMNRPLFPSPWRRWMCGVQIFTAIFALLPWPQPWIPITLGAIGVGGLLFTFGRDFIWLTLHRNDP